MKDAATLVFDGVRLSDGTGAELNLSLQGGDIVRVIGNATAFFDVVAGLQDTRSGVVTFLGEDWAKLTPFEECSRRGRIGRTFPRAKAWVQNLTIRQNVELAALHHRRVSAADLQSKLEDMAQELGVTQSLDLRPEGIEPSILARSQWIRAFTGSPDLLLFETPMQDVDEKYREVLLTWTRDHLAGGGITFWGDNETSAPALAAHNSYVLNINENELAIERR